MKVRFHSMTDLITNSSTVIFTYSDSSPAALEKMIDEIFKVSGVDKRCSDVFDTVVMFEDDDDYNKIFDKELPPPFDDRDVFDKLIGDIAAGREKKPSWLDDLEEEVTNYCDFPCSTVLHVIAKSPEYEPLAHLITKFLYSTEHEATRD